MIKFLSNKEHKSRRKRLYMERELDRLVKRKIIKKNVKNNKNKV